MIIILKNVVVVTEGAVCPATFFEALQPALEITLELTKLCEAETGGAASLCRRLASLDEGESALIGDLRVRAALAYGLPLWRTKLVFKGKTLSDDGAQVGDTLLTSAFDEGEEILVCVVDDALHTSIRLEQIQQEALDAAVDENSRLEALLASANTAVSHFSSAANAAEATLQVTQSALHSVESRLEMARDTFRDELKNVTMRRAAEQRTAKQALEVRFRAKRKAQHDEITSLRARVAEFEAAVRANTATAESAAAPVPEDEQGGRTRSSSSSLSPLASTHAPLSPPPLSRTTSLPTSPPRYISFI